MILLLSKQNYFDRGVEFPGELKMWKMVKGFVVGAVMSVMMVAPTAQAATVDQFQETVGGQMLLGVGTASLSSTGILFGGGAFPAPPVPPLNISISPTSLLLFPPSIPPAPFLTGTLLDTVSADGPAPGAPGTITMLFATSDVSSLSNFGNHALVTLSNTGFSAATVPGLPSIVGVDTYVATSLKIAAAELVAPIPLPAGAWLILSGLGGLLVVGRRRTKLD